MLKLLHSYSVQPLETGKLHFESLLVTLVSLTETFNLRMFSLCIPALRGNNIQNVYMSVNGKLIILIVFLGPLEIAHVSLVETTRIREQWFLYLQPRPTCSLPAVLWGCQIAPNGNLLDRKSI